MWRTKQPDIRDPRRIEGRFMVQYKISENGPIVKEILDFDQILDFVWITWNRKPKSYGAHEYLGWFEDSSVVR
jgi:hypothetical protein